MFLVIPILREVLVDFLGRLFGRIVWLEQEMWIFLSVSGLSYVRRVIKLIVTLVSHDWLVLLGFRRMPVFCSWRLWFRSRRRADCLSWKSPVQTVSQLRETLVAFIRESVSSIRSIWWAISTGRLEIKSTGGLGAEVTPIASKNFRKNSMVMLSLSTTTTDWCSVPKRCILYSWVHVPVSCTGQSAVEFGEAWISKPWRVTRGKRTSHLTSKILQTEDFH